MSESVTFERAMRELTELVAELEKGELSLDDALINYKKGIQLAQQGHELLTRAEKSLDTQASSPTDDVVDE